MPLILILLGAAVGAFAGSLMFPTLPSGVHRDVAWHVIRCPMVHDRKAYAAFLWSGQAWVDVGTGKLPQIPPTLFASIKDAKAAALRAIDRRSEPPQASAGIGGLAPASGAPSPGSTRVYPVFPPDPTEGSKSG